MPPLVKNKGQRSFLFNAVLISSMVLISAACVNLNVNFYSNPQTETELSPSPSENIFSEIEGLECVPDLAHFEVGTLIDVVDGDSIKVIVDGERTQVRYIGVNTPEYDSQQRDAAIAATDENRRLLSGGTLYLFKDQSNTDKYDRLLRYVVANGQFINLALVQSGHAESKWYRPDISCQTVFDAAVP